MKPEFLTGSWNGPAFEQYQPGDGRGVLVRKLPAKGAVKIANGDIAIDNP